MLVNTNVLSAKVSQRENNNKYKNTYELIQKKECLKISILSTFLPRECGIATYTVDLVNSLSTTFSSNIDYSIYALDKNKKIYHDIELVKGVIDPSSKDEYIQLSKELNNESKDHLLLVQHEFGLFKENELAFIHFLKQTDLKKIIVFHTVLPSPNLDLKHNVEQIDKYCDHIIVMTNRSKELLIKYYGIAENKIEVIGHGTHNIGLKNKHILKLKYGLENKKILSTFGLLGPGKSIETTLQALPSIIAKNPDIKFLILGKTHPELIKLEGEKYRQKLEEIIQELELEDHVVFVNRFLQLEELIEYLQLTDIYLFTSNDPNQAVSGTFAYAIASGCPILSTPIPHAREVLKFGMGELFDFGDNQALSYKINSLLEDKEKLHQMKLNGLHYNYTNIWGNSALAHMFLFNNLLKKEYAIIDIPDYQLDYLKKLTTDNGLLQFAQLSNPDINSGYTLDDNARALIFSLEYLYITNDTSILKLLKIYLGYVLESINNQGRFLNYKDYNLTVSIQNAKENLDDVNGRGIWALGVALRYKEMLDRYFPDATFKLSELFLRTLDENYELKSPRAISFIIKGIYEYSQTYKLSGTLKQILLNHSNHLMNIYKSTYSKEWYWFEDYLTYDNAVIPEALLIAGYMMEDDEKIKVAKITFEFLMDKIFKNNKMTVINNKNWFHKGNIENSEEGQQPIDVTSTILALERFDEICPDKKFSNQIDHSFEWFLGRNSLSQMVYDRNSGGCHDGIEENNVNLNMGAESTVSYHLARNVVERKRNRKKEIH